MGEHQPELGGERAHCRTCGPDRVCPAMVIVDGKPIPVAQIDEHAHRLLHASTSSTERGLAMLVLALLDERRELDRDTLIAHVRRETAREIYDAGVGRYGSHVVASYEHAKRIALNGHRHQGGHVSIWCRLGFHCWLSNKRCAECGDWDE